MVHSQKEINEVQDIRGKKAKDLMLRCRKTDKWDGLIRNGIPRSRTMDAVMSFADEQDVRVQLALQIKAGVRLLKKP